MNIYSLLKYCLLSVLTVSLFYSCNDPAHEEFLKMNETVYVGKPEALTSDPGYHRNKLSWLLISDPKISKAKVFWNNPIPAEGDIPIPGQRNPGRDSVVINIQREGDQQLVKTIIDRLREGVYTFEVYTYDAEENSSIRSEIIGDVYGDIYLNSLSNRPLNKAELYSGSKKLVLTWFGISQQAVVIDVEYTDTNGVQKLVQIQKVQPPNPMEEPAFLDVDSVFNYMPGTTFKYRTGYLPVAAAIDTFYTAYAEVETTVPILPDPSIKIKEGSSLVRGTDLYRIDGVDEINIVLTPGITVADLKTEVMSDNQFKIAARVYRSGDLSTPLNNTDLIYDGDVVIFYYQDDESYETKMMASVFAEWKFANSSGLETNVTYSANSGADDSGDRAFANGPEYPYLQTSNSASALNEWVTITCNIPIDGKFDVDLIYKPGSRGDTELYLGAIDPANQIGTRLATGTANEVYLENYVYNDEVTTGHKLSLITMKTMGLTAGDNDFIFKLLDNSGNYRIVLESLQLRFVQ